MKFSLSIVAVPASLVAVLLLANCSSDATPPASTAGTHAGGATSSAGSAGKAGSGGSAVGTGGAAGSSAGGPSAGGSSAGAGTAGGAAVDASFATVRTLIASSCIGGNGCHGQEGNPMPLANDATLFSTLSGHTTANCGKVINTASPADSALVKLLQGDCGTTKKTDRMPYQKCFDGDSPTDNEACVPTATVAAIQAWIAKGAPQQ